MAFKPSHLLLSLCMISPLLGVTNTWSGATLNPTWSLPGNWSGGVPVAGQDLVFPSGAALPVVNTGSLGGPSPAFPTITITAGGGGYFFFDSSSISPIQIGGGTRTLTSSNTGIGGTTMFNGLALNSPNLNIVASNTFFLEGPLVELSSPSALNLSGGGFIFIDNPVNTYSGGITITGPVTELLFFDDGSLGSSGTSITLNNGAFFGPDDHDITLSGRPIILGVGTQTIDVTGNNLTSPGPLSGPGNLAIIGGSTLFLPNANPGFLGNTLIQNGIVNIGNNASLGTTGTVSFDVTPGSTLQAAASIALSNPMALNVAGVIDSQANTLTLNGSIVGVGGASLTKIGSGTLFLTGASTYPGATNVNGGTLVLNGSILSPTTVAAGATLKGTGTLVNTLSVSGTLRPGNSIGTLSVAGPVTFLSGSTYVEELNPTQASLLNVTASTASINSNVTLSIIADPGTYILDTTYTIIHTFGGVSGTFSNVIQNAFPLLRFVPSYTANDVLLTIEKIPNAFSLVVPNGNAGAVAGCLDQASPAPGTDFDNVVSALLFVPNTEDLEHDLNQMQPSQFNAFQLTQENLNTRLFSVLSQRSGQLHRACKPQEKTWGIWGDLFGDFMQQDHQRHQYGFHAASGGALLGLDGRALPHFHLGIGGGYTWTNLEWAGAHGKGEISSGYGFAYGSWHRSKVFIDAAFIGGSNHYEATRHVSFLSFNRHAKSNHHGYTLAGRLLFGVPFKARKAEIAPIFSLDYDFVHQNGFTERNANSLNLHVRGKNANLLRGEAGIRITRRCVEEVVEEKQIQKHRGYSLFAPPPPREQSRPIIFSNARWLPSLQLTVIREWRFEGKHIRSNLVDSNCTMTTTGLNPVRTLLSPAVGVTYLMDKDRVNLTIDYAGEFSVDGKFWDQKGNLQLSYAF